MKTWVLVFLFLSFAFTTTSFAKSSRKPHSKKIYQVGGFVKKHKDKRFLVLDSGAYLYYLKRKETFLKNQLALRSPAKKWITLKVERSFIIKRIPSPSRKAASEAI